MATEFKVGDIVKYKTEYRSAAPEGYKEHHFTIQCIHLNPEQYYLGTRSDDATFGGQECSRHNTRWVARTGQLELIQSTQSSIRKVGSRQVIIKS